MADTPTRNEKLLACLQEKGWTVRHASKVCGIHPASLSSLLHLHTSPSDKRADQIAGVFGKSGAELFPEEYREAGRTYQRENFGYKQKTPRQREITYLNGLLSAALKEKGWRIKDLSEKTGIPPTVLSHYLHCRAPLSTERANYIASFFSKKGEELFLPAHNEFALQNKRTERRKKRPALRYEQIDLHEETLDELARKDMREMQEEDYRQDLMVLVRNAIRLLPYEQQELIKARLVDGKTYDELAGPQTRQAVQQRYARVLLATYGKMQELAAGAIRLPPVAYTLKTVREDPHRTAERRARLKEES